MKAWIWESTILDYEGLDHHSSTFHIKTQLFCPLEEVVQKGTPTTLQILYVSKIPTNRLPGLLNEIWEKKDQKSWIPVSEADEVATGSAFTSPGSSQYPRCASYVWKGWLYEGNHLLHSNQCPLNYPEV